MWKWNESYIWTILRMISTLHNFCKMFSNKFRDTQPYIIVILYQACCFEMRPFAHWYGLGYFSEQLYSIFQLHLSMLERLAEYEWPFHSFVRRRCCRRFPQNLVISSQYQVSTAAIICKRLLPSCNINFVAVRETKLFILHGCHWHDTGAKSIIGLLFPPLRAICYPNNIKFNLHIIKIYLL